MKTTTYTQVYELTAWQVVGSMLPSTVLGLSYQMFGKYFEQYFWPLLQRAQGCKESYRVGFEACKFKISINRAPFVYPDDKRVLLQTEVFTIRDKTELKSELTIRNPVAPFEILAEASLEFVEAVNVGDDWLGEVRVGTALRSEVKDLARKYPGDESKLINVNAALHKVSARGKWIGPVKTDHIVVPDYCEFVGLFAFPTYAGPVMYMARRAFLKAFGKECDARHRAYLESKIEYFDWHALGSVGSALYLGDEFEVQTWGMLTDDGITFKHEVYSKVPHQRVNLFLEELPLPA